MPQDKPTIAQFITDLRNQFGNDPSFPKDKSDEELFRMIAEKKPTILKQVNTVEARKAMKELRADQEGGAAHRFAMGMGETVTPGPLGPFGAPVGGNSPYQKNPDGWDPKQPPAKASDAYPGMPGALIDLPNIKRDFKEGNYAGGAGRITGQVAQAGLLLEGATRGRGAGEGEKALSEIEAGQKATNDAKLNLARKATAHISKTLDVTKEKIDQAMQFKYVNAQRLTAGIASAAKDIKNLKATPGSTMADTSKAVAVVQRLNKQITGKKLMDWSDASITNNELGNAISSLGRGASQLKSSLIEVKKALREAMQDTADKSGQGPQLKKWFADETAYHRVLDEYVDMLKGYSTPDQAMAKKMSGSGVGLTIPKVGRIQLGGDAGAAAAKANRNAFTRVNSAIDALHKRVKEPAAQPKTGPSPLLTQPPSPLIKTPPPGQGMPQITGQSSLFRATPQKMPGAPGAAAAPKPAPMPGPMKPPEEPF